jgi:NADPH2:quinone reductase
MKAIVVRDFDGPEQAHLEEMPDPVPGAGELLVLVHAVSVNTTLDIHMVAGKADLNVNRPVTPGVDPSGVVEAVCDGVTGVKVGDRVAGSTGPPSFGG